MLKEAAAPANTRYDIFLSHSYQDAGEIWQLKEFLVGLGFSTYVDWIEEDDLSRNRVTPATANRLRTRVVNSRCLLVYPTEIAQMSRWMPWELGLADGLGLPVGIIPVVADEVDTAEYSGSEYLGRYAYIDYHVCQHDDENYLWANRNPNVYVRFNEWLEGAPLKHHRD